MAMVNGGYLERPLASFLKRNAIMTYNDAIEEYVLLSINDEKRIAAVTNDYRKVEGLEVGKKLYLFGFCNGSNKK